jgi:plastocyanin
MRRNVFIILLLAALGTACGSSYGGNNNNGPSVAPVPSGPNTVLAPNGAYLGGSNAGFTPGTLTVAAGTTVTWGNNDVTTHNVTSDTGAFTSSNMNSGETVQVKFDNPGQYKYHCNIHSFMTGTIVVQ